ncbi:MAG: anthranilate phosphoribosyltransferase [Campylobacterota bacterium]
MEYTQARQRFEELFTAKMSQEQAKEFLISLYQKGESAQEIAAAASVMRSHCTKLQLPPQIKAQVVDTVGTGGDHIGSINISSTVALVLSSMGVPVAKHGNRSITSKSGSADMLEALGIDLNHPPAQQAKMLEAAGFTFLFAQNHHPAMKYIMPIRKSLPHRTIFNLLGPLTNPAGVERLFIGVFSPDFVNSLTRALQMLECEHAMVVSSKDGMDEISVSDITYAAYLSRGRIKEFEIDPQHFGFKLHEQSSIVGGNARENAQITRDILQNRLDGAKKDIILLNAAGSFIVSGKARDMQDGLQMAKEAIESGKAYEHLQEIIKISNAL